MSAVSTSNSLGKAPSPSICHSQSISSMTASEIVNSALAEDCLDPTPTTCPINSQASREQAQHIPSILNQPNEFPPAAATNTSQLVNALSSPAPQDPVLMARSTDNFLKKVLFGKVQPNSSAVHSIPLPPPQPAAMPYPMFFPQFPYNWQHQAPFFVPNINNATVMPMSPFAYPFPVNPYLQAGMFNPYAPIARPQTPTPTPQPAKKPAIDPKKVKRSFSRVNSPTNTSSTSSYTPRSPSKYGRQDLDLGFIKAPVVIATDNTPMTVYFTKTYCFSNHYPCDMLAIDGIKYLCTEQYYIYYKAHLFGDKHSALAVMSTTDPKVMKRIGATVLNFDEKRWLPVSIQVMVIACQRKYEQNPGLRRQLFSTADTLLVEANPADERWGIGLSMDSMLVRDKRNWRGQNIMGRLLSMLRDRLLRRPQFAAERRRILAKHQQFGQKRPVK